MKALQMTFKSEVVRAMKNPVKDLTKLRGGNNSNILQPSQIRRILEEKKLEQKARAMKNEQRYLAAKLGVDAARKKLANKDKA